MARLRAGAAGLLASLLASGALAAEELVEGIAAQVGSDVVLVSEVHQLAAPIEAQLRAAGAPSQEFAKLQADVLEGLVERALISQLVRRSELGATDEEVDRALGSIAAENGLTLDQLRASVESQGLSFDLYLEKIRGEIEHNKVLNGMVASRVRVEDSEVRAVFEQEFADQPVGGAEVHLRHLLVPFTSDDPAAKQAACAQVEGALAEIRAGADFRNLALELSPVAPERGGDLGWLHAETLAAWMKPAVAALEPGQTSPVLRTPFGCNLLQLVERREFEPFTYEQVRERIHARLFNERMRMEYVVFIEKLRGQTYVERKGLFAGAAQLGSAPPAGSAMAEPRLAGPEENAP